jgi:hypothetical protein
VVFLRIIKLGRRTKRKNTFESRGQYRSFAGHWLYFFGLSPQMALKAKSPGLPQGI